MNNLFITKIMIDALRHVSGLAIPLSEHERKHLILTGKNGSGKTTLLETMRDYMRRPSFCRDADGSAYLSDPTGTQKPEIHGMNTSEEAFLSPHNKTAGAIRIYVNAPDGQPVHGVFNDTLVVYISAHRLLTIPVAKAIERVDAGTHVPLDADLSSGFLQYMLYLDYQKLSAASEGNHATESRIAQWFDRFLQTLREVYGCPALALKKEAKDLNFNIVMPDREPFSLQHMADGYSALLKIVMELIMRMEHQAHTAYDMPGIVLIDELEAHLHIELQKKVLPFLTGMFPNIQFIISTHSPFVISSIDKAVIYDLEHQQRLEDLSAYSYEGIVEYYFNTDMYSDKIKSRFERYKALIAKIRRTPEENDELVELIVYLKQIPPAAASELIYSFRELERQRKDTAHG
ncbi:MAG: ATP-binding protein [Treponema sp.]|jgi:predicted ATPase|nr:ATP-binding protein [Treponema sp.]